MKIVVCVKEVPEPNAISTLDSDTVSLVNKRQVFIINPLDELALEEALRVKDESGAGVAVVTVGPARAEETLRRCLAMGADEAVHIVEPPEGPLNDHHTAFLLSSVIEDMNCDLVLCGKMSMDSSNGFVGPALAEILKIPLVVGVISMRMDLQSKATLVYRRMERGDREVVECPLPALFTVDHTLNFPRYPTVPRILKSLYAEINIIRAEHIFSGKGVKKRHNETELVKYSPPRPRTKKVFVPDSDLPPEERLRLLMSGGVSEKEGGFVEESPEKAAERLIEFLKVENILQ